MSHASVEAGSASDPVVMIARIIDPEALEIHADSPSASVEAQRLVADLFGARIKRATEKAEAIIAALARSPAPAVPESVRRLSEAATQGEWSRGVDDGRIVKIDGAGGTRCVPEQNVKWSGLAHFITRVDDAPHPTGEANADFAIAAVNFVRTLLASDPPSGRAGEESNETFDARVSAALAAWNEAQRTATVDEDQEDTDYGAMMCAVAAADALAPAPAPAHGSAESEGWQPIETAPTDQPVLLGQPGRPPVRGTYHLGAWWLHGCGPWSNHRVPLTGDCAPTHWRPLPSPPATQPDSTEAPASAAASTQEEAPHGE